jgi:hypothetical protein
MGFALLFSSSPTGGIVLGFVGHRETMSPTFYSASRFQFREATSRTVTVAPAPSRDLSPSFFF